MSVGEIVSAGENVAERIMALDVGEKNIGVALSDPLEITAQGLTVIKRRDEAGALAAIRALVDQYAVRELVVGLPRDLKGKVGPQAQKVLDFTSRLERELAVPIRLWDERLSTRAAERLLIEADVTRRKRRRVVDMLAASIILQNYLDSRRSSP